MTNFEIITTVIGIINVLIIGGGLIYAGMQASSVKLQLKYLIEQMKMSRKIHQDNHEWNRRLATQEHLTNLSKLDMTLIQKEIQLINRKETYPAQVLVNKFKENEKLFNDCLVLLNLYERLCSGISYGIFDADMVKDARKTMMIDTYISFKDYILFSRNKDGRRYWIHYEHVVTGWIRQDTSINKKNTIALT